MEADEVNDEYHKIRIQSTKNTSIAVLVNNKKHRHGHDFLGKR
jgi:hypothetical protein